MDEQKNIVISFNEKAVAFLSDIEKKYNLEENGEEIIKNLEEDKPLKIDVVIKLTKDLMTEKISNKEFLDSLHKDLKISKETTKNLSLDIVNGLIPLLKKFTEEELESYRRLKKAEATDDTLVASMGPEARLKKVDREELLKRLNANKAGATRKPAAPKMPYIKKPAISDVEKNAENIAPFHKRPPNEIINDQVSIPNKLIEEQPAPVQEPEETKKFPPKSMPTSVPQPPSGNPDPYKEPIE